MPRRCAVSPTFLACLLTKITALQLSNLLLARYVFEYQWSKEPKK
ncbi:MAG: hypothetical protein AAGK47_00095 [Bacteroidota bacterium]